MSKQLPASVTSMHLCVCREASSKDSSKAVKAAAGKRHEQALVCVCSKASNKVSSKAIMAAAGTRHEQALVCV